MNTLKRKRKGGDENGEAKGLEDPSEDSEGKKGQLGKEGHLARRVLMAVGSPLCFFQKSRAG